MAKLFAFEEDQLVGDEVAGVEVADEVVQEVPELQEEAAGVDEGIEAVEEGEAAAGQLEEVQEVVEGSIEQGEGLEPVAAESLRIAVEAICARIGAPTKQYYALYATENFQSKASRVANSKLALESITESLKNIWAKIKAFLSGLVAKVVAVWNKIFNNVGRAVKAVKAMQEKVAKLQGAVPADTADLAAPGVVLKAVGKAEIDAAAFRGVVGNFTSAAAALFDKLSADKPAAFDETYPLPFGKTLKIKSEVQEASEGGVPYAKYEVELADAAGDQPETATAKILSKGEMKDVLAEVAGALAGVLKTAEKTNDLKKALDAMEKGVEKNLATLDASKEEDKVEKKKALLAALKAERASILGKIKAVSPSVNVLGVRLAGAAITYVKASMGKYKAA